MMHIDLSIKEEEMMHKIFEQYLKMQKEKELYSNETFLPQNIIKFYFQLPDRLSFDQIMSNFKRKYIENENNLENVHIKEERQGLKEVYNYIQSDKWQQIPNIYVILMIHIALYSKVPYKEFGGTFRNVSACISNSDVKTIEPENISMEISKLYFIYDELYKMGMQLKEPQIKNGDQSNELIEYIDRVIELKCRLIEIHPFADGNGRTCRALVNLLFRNAGLPPVYVKNKEKKEYIYAMDQAIRSKNTKIIKKFYYYKICDSIIELDLKETKEKEKTLALAVDKC